MERRSQCHGVDHELGIGKVEPDDLEKIPGSVRADGEHLRRVSIRFQVHEYDRVLDGVTDGLLVVAVLRRRSVIPHT